MRKGDRVRSGQGKIGPGGLKCECCGGSHGRKGKSKNREVKEFVRRLRRADNKRSIAEGLREID